MSKHKVTGVICCGQQQLEPQEPYVAQALNGILALTRSKLSKSQIQIINMAMQERNFT